MTEIPKSPQAQGARRLTTRRALAALVGLLILAALVGWLAGTEQAEPIPRDASQGATPGAALGASAVLARGLEPGGASSVAGSVTPPSPPLVPIVDAIELEKDEVCEGEENLVTIRAHTEGHLEDGFLHAVVAGTPGMAVPVRATRGEDGRAAPAIVTVFGRDNVPTTVPVPSYRVKACTETRFLVIEWRLKPGTDAEYDLRAQVLDTEGHFSATRWTWDFGDGARLETGQAYAQHDYGERPQDALYSHFLIRVEAVDADGKSVLGRAALSLRNAAHSNLLYAGVVSLMIRLEPRFPVLDASGVVRHQVRLWHHQKEPVRITRITTRRNYDDERAPVTGEVAVEKLLGTRRIPHAGITTAVSLDTKREPGLFSIDYELEGEAANGLPVRGMFSVMVPPPAPTPETSTPVQDPLQRAKIRKAMSLLGKPYVTEADLQQLELQGAFDDLRAPAAPAVKPPPPRYGDLPPHPPRRAEPSADTSLTGEHDAPPLPPDIPPEP